MTYEPEPDDLLRVKASSNPSSLASAISHAVYDNKKVVLRAIGAGAVNQAMKAVAIARSFVASRAIDLYCVPGFGTVVMPDKEEISAMVIKIYVKE